MPQKLHEQILAETHHIVFFAIDNLLKNIELKVYPQYVFNISEGWELKDIAARLRQVMNIHPGKPVKEVVRLVEEMGIIVYFYHSKTPKFEGMTCYTNKGIPVIVVNKNFPADRIKLTVIHELIHLVAHIPCIIEPWRETEDEAFQGAFGFFMPRNDCYEDLQNFLSF